MAPTTLDLLDLKLLQARELDGRASFSRIARVLGVSDQTIARRFRRLQGTEVVCAMTPPARQDRDDVLLDGLEPARRPTSVDAHCILRSYYGGSLGRLRKISALTAEEQAAPRTPVLVTGSVAAIRFGAAASARATVDRTDESMGALRRGRDRQGQLGPLGALPQYGRPLQLPDREARRADRDQLRRDLARPAPHQGAVVVDQGTGVSAGAAVTAGCCRNREGAAVPGRRADTRAATRRDRAGGDGP